VCFAPSINDTRLKVEGFAVAEFISSGICSPVVCRCEWSRNKSRKKKEIKKRNKKRNKKMTKKI
jgi:hypothetical protein